MLKVDIENMSSKHSCEIYNYFSTSTLTPQTICVSSIHVPDAVERLRGLEQHIDITSG